MVKKTIKIADANSVILGGGYESPKVKVVRFQSEGILCASVENGHDGFIYDDEEIL